MKTGGKILIIFIILVAIAALAYVIYKVTKTAPPSQPNPNTLPNTGYSGSGSGSGNTSGSGNNNPPPPPVNPAGKTALANQDGVQVYYSSPFGPYKVANKGEWIGTVIRTYENGDYYLIDDGSSPNKLAFVTQVTLA